MLGALVFFAGIVDALAGGGGLITLPAFLAAGLEPSLLLGTNKLCMTIGTSVSTVRYARSLRFALKPFLPVIATSLLGSYLGARLALLLDPSYLRWLLLAALPVVGYAVFSSKDFGRRDESARYSSRELTLRQAAIAFPIGAYDGFFGPGTGTFFALAFCRFCGFSLLEATGRSKALNLASNAAALVAFVAAGRLDVRLGLSMGVLSVVGNFIGANLGVKRGAAVIRPAVLCVCAGLFLKLAFG